MQLEPRPDLVAMLADARALPPAALQPEEQEAIASLALILRLAAAQLKLVFRERGLVDHAEISAIARQALRALDEDAGFSLRQTLRVSHLLVDECQDTSPDQMELVRALTAGWQRGDARSLFLVGDPMQSIYLFRGSEVGLFLQVRHHGVGAIRLDAAAPAAQFPLAAGTGAVGQRCLLRGSFRAAENLRSSAVTFLPAEHARAPDARLDAGVTFWPQVADDAQAEARAIAAEIGALRARQPALSIAVLVQTRAAGRAHPAGPARRRHSHHRRGSGGAGRPAGGARSGGAWPRAARCRRPHRLACGTALAALRPAAR